MSHTKQWIHNGNAAHVGTKCMFTVPCEGNDEVKRATYPERHARAALIVKCVNAHEKLVAALEFYAQPNGWTEGREGAIARKALEAIK